MNALHEQTALPNDVLDYQEANTKLNVRLNF